MSASTRNPPQRRRSLGPVSPKHIYRNLSVRLRGGEAAVARKTVAPRTKRKDTPAYKTLWEAVENEDTLSVQSLLSRDAAPGSLAAGGSGGGGGGMWERGEKKEKDWEREREKSVNRVSEQGLVPLDVAALTQNSPLLHVLTKAGARHNPVLCRPAEWSFKLDSLVALADKRVEERKKELATHAGAGSQAQADAQRQLRLWTLRQQLYGRMRESFHQTGLPAPPSSVSLLVTSATSLFVSIRGPDSADTGLITRYRVEWSTTASFKRGLDSAQITDARSPSFNITGLETGVLYFVRASAYNVKGWGPPKNSSPDSAAPSSWTECVGVKAHSNQEALLSKLLEQTREPHYRGYCMESSKPQSPSKRLSVSRGLKQLFQSATKFVRLLQRGVYLATVFYHKDNILVTADDQLPLVEIQCCSTSITQDFLWFAKLSCAWQQVPWLQRALSSTLSSSSSLLQNRHNILRAVSQLQSSLGTSDLGQVYYEPLKDRHGNVLLVTLREFGTPPGPPDPPLHWVPLVRLEKNRCRTPLLPEPTAMDTLTEQLKDKMAYHRRSIQWAQPGLYVGILKLCSSVEQIRVLVPQKLPNLLCHTRVRHNPHVSREEWTWLQSHVFTTANGTAQSLIGSEEDSQMDSSGLGDFVRSLRAAVTLLLTKLNIPLYRAYQYGVYTRELLQFGEKVSLLLLLPPSEDFSSSYWPLVGTKEPGLTMPLQIFELAHFWTYKRDFLSQYCQAWVRLELDAHLSQQALREALDTKEVLVARERQTHVTQLSQRLDVVWRETRWIMDVLQCVRSKQWVGAVPLGLVMGGDPPPRPDSEEEEQYLTARVWPQGTPVQTVEDTSVNPNIASNLSSEILAPSSLQLATPEETVLLLVEGVAKGGYPVDVCAQSSLDLNSSGQSEFECGTGIIQSGMEPALVCQSDAGFADLSLPETLYEEEAFPNSFRSDVMQPLSELVAKIPALSVMEEHLPTDSASSLDAVDVFDNYGPGVSATNALFELENSKVDLINRDESEVASSDFLHGAQSQKAKVPCDETSTMLSLGLGDRLCVTFLSYRDTTVSPVAAPAEKFDLPLEAVVTPVLHRGCCLPPVRNQVEWISSSKKS